MKGYPLILFLLSFIWSCKSSDVAVQFSSETIDDQVAIGYGLAIGDVDGDGLEDILLADKKQFVWYRNPDWQRFVMVDSLTKYDNVCIAATDINNDGQVEVAVGAQWNPRVTWDSLESGSVHYLVRPKDPTQLWQPVALGHEPTVHRMHWVQTLDGYQLVVLPLHGRGNRNGVGRGVRIMAYTFPDLDKEDYSWGSMLIDSSMHLTHNFDVLSQNKSASILIGGKEGAKHFSFGGNQWEQSSLPIPIKTEKGFGEIRYHPEFVAGIQPLHGNSLTVFNKAGETYTLTDSLNQGHALAIGDLLHKGSPQIVVGWRNKNDAGDIGIRLYVPSPAGWSDVNYHWIDQNGMACEDLKLADLNQDGRLDIIAAGRSTQNLKIYWNKSGKD